jgi:hypothetical protein
MSIKAIAKVWDYSTIAPHEKFVLLAYVDHAHHDGTNIYPAVETVARKTGYTERTVQRLTKRLEEAGLLIADGQGPKGTNKWKFNMEWEPLQGDIRAGRGDIRAEKVSPMSPEPSLTVLESKEPPSEKALEESPSTISQEKNGLLEESPDVLDSFGLHGVLAATRTAPSPVDGVGVLEGIEAAYNKSLTRKLPLSERLAIQFLDHSNMAKPSDKTWAQWCRVLEQCLKAASTQSETVASPAMAMLFENKQYNWYTYSSPLNKKFRDDFVGAMLRMERVPKTTVRALRSKDWRTGEVTKY